MRCEKLEFSYNGNSFITNFDFEVNEKDFISIIGRNGSGKTTLIKLICGLISNYAGNIYLHSADIKNINRKEIAKILAYLPQYGVPMFNQMKVRDFILLGRYSSKGNTQFSYSFKDKSIAEKSLEILKIENLKDKNLNELSGGERQKVLIALTLVQLDITADLKGKILIIDEPLTYLDINHQIEIFELLSNLNGERNLTIIVITHDLNIAMKYTKKSLLLDNGKNCGYGKSAEIINSDMLKKHFLVKSRIVNIDNYSQIHFN
ncbi:MAG: ABC transporter ATP-binding protein [Ignavibacteria bacterium]|nr:ABC transporter ATP-binding protein [Ignavibacteria bacterium]